MKIQPGLLTAKYTLVFNMSSLISALCMIQQQKPLDLAVGIVYTGRPILASCARVL